jgi:hypothetical protein
MGLSLFYPPFPKGDTRREGVHQGPIRSYEHLLHPRYHPGSIMCLGLYFAVFIRSAEAIISRAEVTRLSMS